LEIDPGQIRAVKECAISKVRDAGRDSNVGQAGAKKERLILNPGDAVKECNARQTGALTERPATEEALSAFRPMGLGLWPHTAATRGRSETSSQTAGGSRAASPA